MVNFNKIYYNKYMSLRYSVNGCICAINTRFLLLKASAGTKHRLTLITCRRKLESLALMLRYPTKYPTLAKLKTLYDIEREFNSITELFQNS